MYNDFQYFSNYIKPHRQPHHCHCSSTRWNRAALRESREASPLFSFLSTVFKRQGAFTIFIGQFTILISEDGFASIHIKLGDFQGRLSEAVANPSDQVSNKLHFCKKGLKTFPRDGKDSDHMRLTHRLLGSISQLWLLA